jgi:hypothetical protein
MSSLQINTLFSEVKEKKGRIHKLAHKNKKKFEIVCDQESLLPTLFPLSGVGTTCFSSCCDKDSVIYDQPA